MADKKMDLKFSDLFDSASVLEDGSGLKGSRSELSDEHHQKCDGFVYTGRGTTSYSETIGAGLDNLGNTCYVNAALQCFIHATPFLELIFHKQPVQCNCNYKERDLARFLLRQKKRGVSLSPWPLVNNIKYFSENFRRNEHEDVSEFIESLLNKLELCYNVPSKNDDMPSESHNLVQHTFQFLLVSKLKCSTCCQTFSTSHENFYNLSLPIVAGQTFLEALRSFMGVEKIDNHICGKCKEVVSAEKQYYIETIPSIAIFQLKIFSNKGPIMNKFGEHVHFPLQFDMLSYNETVDNIEDNYRLCALIVHIGSTLERGHYNCFIRLAAKKWLKFDDSIVESVDEDLVLAENPYILFYAHPDVSWFSTYISSVDWLANNLDSVNVPDGIPPIFEFSGVDTYDNSVSDVVEGKTDLSCQETSDDEVSPVSDVEESKDNLFCDETVEDEVSPVSDAEQSNDNVFCDETFEDVVSPVSYVEQHGYSLLCDETFEDAVPPVSNVEEVTTASKRKLEEDSENLARNVAYSILGKKRRTKLVKVLVSGGKRLKLKIKMIALPIQHHQLLKKIRAMGKIRTRSAKQMIFRKLSDTYNICF